MKAKDGLAAMLLMADHFHECPHEGSHVWPHDDAACMFKGRDMTCFSFYPEEQKHHPSIKFLRARVANIRKALGEL